MRLLKNDRSKEKYFFISILVIYVVFLLFRILSKNYYLDDSYEYLDIASKIYNFTVFDVKNSYLLSKRPLIYPLFLAIFYKLPILITVLVQNLISLGSIVLILKILRKTGVEIKSYYIILFVLTPSIYIYTHLIMAEVLVFFFITLLFWFLLQKITSSVFFCIQLITILLAFVKPVFYPIIYINFIFFSVYFIRNRTFSIWLFMPILLLQIFMNINKERLGYRHFSSMENVNLINYNLYYFKTKTASKEAANTWRDAIYDVAYQQKTIKGKNIYLQDIVKKELKQNFFTYSMYHLYTSIRGMFDPGRFDLMTLIKKENGTTGFLEVLNDKNRSVLDFLKQKHSYIYIMLIPIFIVNMLKWFYFSRYVVLQKLNFPMYYIIVIMFSYILLSGPVNSARYLMPFQGILIIFTLLGMTYKKRKPVIE